MTKKILVSGATGFIGSHLVKKLLENDYHVGIIKRKKSDTWRIRNIFQKLDVFELDICKLEEVSIAFNEFKPDVFFHLATYYVNQHTSEDILPMINTNVMGTLNLLEASIKSGVERFVNTSSCFVYDKNVKVHNENDKVRPVNLYANTKVQSEFLCDYFSREYGLKAITLRLFPPYGPLDHDNKLIPHIIQSIIQKKELNMTTGRQKWDYTYIDDVVDAFIKTIAIPIKDNKHEVFNIGRGNPISVKEIYYIIKENMRETPKVNWGAIPHRKNEIWHTSSDSKKAYKYLKWKPKIGIEHGLEKTIEWYRNL